MTVFQARISLLPDAVAPDEYDPSKGRIPIDNFVVSRNKDGSALSLYGQLSWDRTPYEPEGRTAKLYFDFWTEGALTPQRDQLAREMRWLMFALIYLRVGPALSNGTLKNYQTVQCVLARFCESRSIRIQDLLADPLLLIESFAGNMSSVSALFGLIKLLKSLGPDVVGFDVVNIKAIQELQKNQRAWLESNRQHPPIPTRIYSTILSALSQELDAFERVADRVLDLFNECANDPITGRHPATQWEIGNRLKLENITRRPTFPDLLQKYELEEYWSERGYEKSVKGLSTTFTEIMVIASLQIQVFTGMRANEVAALPYHCLDEVRREEDCRTHYIVKGRVTKHAHGMIKRVQWVTSESGQKAIQIAQRVSQAIYKGRGETPKKTTARINTHHLFISPRFVTHRAKNVPTDFKLYDFGKLRALFQPIIKEEDLLELEQIDPHRAWRSEETFQIGLPWTLTTHQLRRSLALYAQRSGLVSLPSLKRQLQHITQEMAAYYCRGSAFADNFIGDNTPHFGTEWQDTQPISQFLSYATHVLLTDETLFGAHPHWVMNRLRDSNGIVVFDRELTLKRFQKGAMAYRETILGGCVKIGECDRNPLDLLEVDCLSTHCKNLVGNKKKLERVIAVQSRTVERLEQIDPKSPECRHEKANLSVLKSTLANVLNNAEAPKEAA